MARLAEVQEVSPGHDRLPHLRGDGHSLVDLSGHAEKALLVNVFALLGPICRRKPEADVLPTSLHSSMLQLFHFLASLKTSWNTSSVCSIGILHCVSLSARHCKS